MEPSVCGCLLPSVSRRADSASRYSGSASASRPVRGAARPQRAGAGGARRRRAARQAAARLGRRGRQAAQPTLRTSVYSPRPGMLVDTPLALTHILRLAHARGPSRTSHRAASTHYIYYTGQLRTCQPSHAQSQTPTHAQPHAEVVCVNGTSRVYHSCM